MAYFIVENDRQKHEATWFEFEDMAEALAALSVKEAERRPEVEVVFFMAESLDQLRITHSRFFMGPGEMFQRISETLAAMRQPLNVSLENHPPP